MTIPTLTTPPLRRAMNCPLRVCRRLAASVRARFDRLASEAELVDVTGEVVALQHCIERARATRDNTVRTRDAAARYTGQLIDPLRWRQDLIVERTNQLRARTLRGHRARTRMVVARLDVAQLAPFCVQALMRDLAGEGVSEP